jgi:hypothetical protein
MFGKPQWFVPKKFGWGLHPVTWQGWVYTLAWAGVIAAPFIVLMMRHQPLEAGIWMLAACLALFYDVYLILRQMRGEPAKKERPAAQSAGRPNDVLFIGDDAEPVATRNFQLRRKA